jgi:hypothetical protein
MRDVTFRSASMIAVIERKHKAVWGFGLNKSEAMTQALKEISNKPKFNVEKDKLEYAELKDDAPLHLDGEVLFEYCLFASDKSDIQLGLFD